MKFKGWDKTTIITDDGTCREGIAPLIVSASRATDIPAFHSSWLMERIRRGYVRWTNPFNQVPQYVSFVQTRVFVFWSKNPAPLLHRLAELDERGLNYYFQFTVNDYEAEALEPHVPALNKRIATFRELAARIGRERVIWRFDPLILAKDLTVDRLVEKVKRVGDQLADATGKLVISFADVREYAKVRHQLARGNVSWRDFTAAEIEDLAARIAELSQQWGLPVATCAEALDLGRYGITPNRCIDDELMIRLFAHDRALMEFLFTGPQRTGQKALFPSPPTAGTIAKPAGRLHQLKDPGQRQACGCIVSKDIGQYNTCGHLCRYCYANTSAAVVKKNLENLDVRGDCITGPGNHEKT